MKSNIGRNIAVVCCAIAALAVLLSLHLFRGIRLEREVSLANDHSGMPTVITRTIDDDYVIAGSSFAGAWAKKIDSHGAVLWSYESPKLSEQLLVPVGTNRFFEAGFKGAVPTSDGGVLLCGSVLDHGFGSGPGGIPSKDSGLVVRLDGDGHVLNQMIGYQYPFEGDADQIISTKLEMCAPSEDGFIVLGPAYRHDKKPPPSGPFVTSGGLVVMRLHNDGSVESQKIVRGGGGYLVDDSQPQGMPDGGFEFASGWTAIRIDKDGAQLGAKELSPGCRQVFRNDSADDLLRFVCNQNGAPSVRHTQVLDLDRDLHIVKGREYASAGMSLKKVQGLPDGILMLFGYTDEYLPYSIPTVVEYSPDGSIISKYRLWLPSNDGWFVDGTSGVHPNEMVGLRWTSGNRIYVDFLRF